MGFRHSPRKTIVPKIFPTTITCGQNLRNESSDEVNGYYVAYLEYERRQHICHIICNTNTLPHTLLSIEKTKDHPSFQATAIQAQRADPYEFEIDIADPKFVEPKWLRTVYEDDNDDDDEIDDVYVDNYDGDDDNDDDNKYDDDDNADDSHV